MAGQSMSLERTRSFVGGADMTEQCGKVTINGEREEKDVTRFVTSGNAWKQVKGGLITSKIDMDLDWAAGDDSLPDNVANAIGTHYPVSVGPDDADAGDLAYLTKALSLKWLAGGDVGDVAPAVLALAGTWPMPRGVFLHPPGTARTSSGDGTAVEHVAVATGQRLYANLHVLSVSGTDTPTLTVIVESDDTADFDGSESTRISFAAATAIGGEASRLAGPITDTFYRVSWTISGTNPSFLFAVSLGVA